MRCAGLRSSPTASSCARSTLSRLLWAHTPAGPVPGVNEQKRMLEASSCEGCMRACWIDTSSMFRTMEGFFDTVKLTLRPRRGTPLDTEAALALARVDDLPPLAATGK